jgi:hypothetical protein
LFKKVFFAINRSNSIKNIPYLIIFVASGSAVTNDTGGTIKGSFEEEKSTEYFRYNPSDIFGGVSYFSSSVGGVRRYDINVLGECNTLQIYKPFKSKNTIVLDGSCDGQGSQVHRYIYQWDKRYTDWCLREEVSGERADRTSGSDIRLATDKVEGCIPFGSGSK